MYGNTTNAAPAYPTAANDVPPADDRPLAVLTLEAIRSARQRVETLASRSMNIADRVFGPVPQGVAGSGSKTPEPGCAKASFELELRELHNAIEWLDQQVARLDRVA